MGKELVEQEKLTNSGDCFCSENSEACCGDCDLGGILPFDFDALDDEIESLAYKAFKTGLLTATVIGAVAFLAYKGVKRSRRSKAMHFTVKH